MGGRCVETASLLVHLVHMAYPGGRCSARTGIDRASSPISSAAAFTRSPLAGGIAGDSAQDDIPPTRWKEGALIGGLTAGVGLASFFGALCRGSEGSQDCSGTFAAGFVLGAVLGGTIGALIGGQIPKEDQ
jgi:hypothetical protein